MFSAAYCREEGKNGCVVNTGTDRDNGCVTKVAGKLTTNRYCAEPEYGPAPETDKNGLVFTVCDGGNRAICERRYQASTKSGLPAPANRDDTDVKFEKHGQERRCYVPAGNQVVTCRGFYFNDAIDNNDPAGPELKATFTLGIIDYEVKWHLNANLEARTIKVIRNGVTLIKHIDGHNRQRYLNEYARYFDQCRLNVKDSGKYDWTSAGGRTFFPAKKGAEAGPVNNNRGIITF
jgi:hypothetical protein